MTRTAWIVIVLVALVAFFAGWRMALHQAALRIAETAKMHPADSSHLESSSPYTSGQIERWIKTLSLPVDSERAQAEKELADAGAYAEPALKAAAKTATGVAREALQRLLDRQRFLTMSDLNYPSAVPSDAAGYVYVNDVSATLDDLNQTALAHLWQSPALDNLRPRILELAESELEHNRIPPPQYLKRQLALTLFSNAPAGSAKLGAFFELIGTDPQGDYYELAQSDLKNGGNLFHYKNIECIDAGAGKGAHTRTGRNVIFASDTASLQKLIDGVLENKGIGATDGARRVSEALSKRGVSAVIDVPGVLRRLREADPVGGGFVEQLLNSAVIGKMDFVGFSSSCRKLGFEDRLVCLLPDGPRGIAAALTVPPGGHPPLELLDSVPATALVAGMGYFDGALLEKSVLATLQGLQTLNSKKDQPPEGLLPLLRGAENKMGIAEGELLKHVQGEAGFWIVLRPGLPADTVDLGALLTAPTPQAAAELGNLIEKFCGTLSFATVERTTFKGHALRELKALLFLGTPKWSFNWTVDGRRIHLATSPRLLERHLENIERNAPGLLTHAAFTNALGEFSAEERRGSVLYADARTLLTLAAAVTIPAARADPGTSPEVRKVLDALPSLNSIFDEVPPLVAFTVTRPDRGEWILHSPVPVAPSLTLAALKSARDKAAAATPAESK